VSGEGIGSKKVYAVRRGFLPGIYVDWVDCKKQVNRFSGAEYRGFKTREEVER
jgi:viroplasmin and RNaseH domain-containing protein